MDRVGARRTLEPDLPHLARLGAGLLHAADMGLEAGFVDHLIVAPASAIRSRAVAIRSRISP
jgi:hypothetical protein